jgi:DNA-binding MarR family transcriptional regulator
MPNQTKEPAPDRAPLVRLAEGELHGVLGYQLAQATIVATEVFAATVGQVHGLRPVEYTILALIDANPGLTARQLAKALAVTPPNIAVWLDRLESGGHIVRSRSATDARMQHIRATRSGAELARRSTQRLVEAERAALSGLSAAERGILVELLHKAALCRKRPPAR